MSASPQFISFKRNLSINEQFSIDEIIETEVSGNLFSHFQHKFKIPEEWKRNYRSNNLLFIICFWIPLTIPI